LDRTPQEPGHYDDYHDRHPRNGSAPCLDGLCSGAGAPLHKRTPVAALRKMAILAVDSDPNVQFDCSSRSVLVIARHEIALCWTQNDIFISNFGKTTIGDKATRNSKSCTVR
jgi:hypothetical protein